MLGEARVCNGLKKEGEETVEEGERKRRGERERERPADFAAK